MGLVFIDETGTSTNMARARGRCRRGERLIGKVPHGHWKITTFVAGLRCGAITAPSSTPSQQPNAQTSSVMLAMRNPKPKLL